MSDSRLTYQELRTENSALKKKIQSLETSVEKLKQTELAWRESEKRYRLFAEKMTDIVWIMDSNLRPTYISPSIQRILGFTPEERRRRDIKEQLTPSSLRVAYDLLAEELEMERQGTRDPGKIVTIELEAFHKDGSTRWLEVIVSAINGDQGAMTGFCGVSRDITKRRKAEEALQHSRDNFRRSLDDSPLGVRILSEEGETIYCNQAILDIYGFNGIEELRATPAKVRYTPESFAEFKIRRKQRKSGEKGPSEYEIGIVRKDGEVRHLQVIRKEILWDGTRQYQAIYKDITKRKQAEEELRRSEEYFREIIQNSSDLIFTVDKRGIINYGSPSVARILGYMPGELRGTSVFDLFAPEDLPRAIRDFEMALKTKDVPIPNRFRIRHKDGTVHIMEGVGKNLLHNPAVASFVTNVRDITEEKLAEEERLKLESKLQLAQKMEAIGTLASGIAHDFNNLLTGVQGHVSMLLLNSNSSQANCERLKQIEKLVRSGAQLTGRLLGFASGKSSEVRPVDMNDIIEQTLLMFGRTKKEVSIMRNYAQDLWTVEVDEGQMEQVLMNLYVNAWQAMQGAGEIHLETNNVCFDSNSGQGIPVAVKPGRFVRISVTDNGMGMDEKTKERIFDPFFTTKEKGGGTGLGLTSVYGIIKGHEGTIDVFSKPGRGTTFHICLPASKQEAVKEKHLPAEVLTGTETILLVDDESINLEVTSEILETMGYKVYRAASGQEAIAVYMEKRDSIDLVVLDMIMPGISGGETFDRLREINPELRILLASGYNVNTQVQQILARGCNGFLQKPFHPGKLSRKIRQILA